MSLTATVGTNSFGLPRVSLTISSTSGAAITAVALSRTVAGATVPTRVQPSPGPSPRTVNDYEPEWDVNVAYRAVVSTPSGTETFTSAAVVVTADCPWAIHPTTPALSIKLDQANPNAAGLRTAGNITRDASDTPHTVFGSAFRVFTTTGPRSAPTLSIELVTVTSLEAQGVRALVKDLTPILIRVPDSWGWDWEDGYYRVGAIDEARRLQYGAEASRVFTLPLERVEEPAGSQQSERTWANVLNDFPTWAAVRAAYGTWTDVLTDTRS